MEEKKELGERLTELAKARGFVCEAPSGKVKDLQLTFNQKELVELIDQEVGKAREEGYQNCMDDIWEEARGLRGWTEHDGSISSADIEAGLQEAYLNIENKLKDNK